MTSISAERHQTLTSVTKQIRAQLRDRFVKLGCWSIAGDADALDCDVLLELAWCGSVRQLAALVDDAIDALSLSDSVKITSAAVIGDSSLGSVKLWVRD